VLDDINLDISDFQGGDLWIQIYEMVEAAEVTLIYNCLKCICKAKSAQKVSVKVTAESAGFD
jgi:hypothetical protein